MTEGGGEWEFVPNRSYESLYVCTSSATLDTSAGLRSPVYCTFIVTPDSDGGFVGEVTCFGDRQQNDVYRAEAEQFTSVRTCR